VPFPHVQALNSLKINLHEQSNMYAASQGLGAQIGIQIKARQLEF
jgi:hypothetical protein